MQRQVKVFSLQIASLYKVLPFRYEKALPVNGDSQTDDICSLQAFCDHLAKACLRQAVAYPRLPTHRPNKPLTKIFGFVLVVLVHTSSNWYLLHPDKLKGVLRMALHCPFSN